MYIANVIVKGKVNANVKANAQVRLGYVRLGYATPRCVRLDLACVGFRFRFRCRLRFRLKCSVGLCSGV